MANEIDVRYANWLLSKATKVGDCLICHLSKVSGGYCKVIEYGWAHRYIYEFIVEPIPEGKLIMHTCDNRACINPKHLCPGTHYDNMTDMWSKGRGRVGRRNHGSNNALKVVDGAKLEKMKELEARGYSQRAIGNEVGVSQFTVRNYLKGIREPL